MDDQINYGNKAKNLEFVANHTDIEIPYFRELSLKDLENINEILNDFSEEIMIRSNSSNEDLESSSNAGKYLSIGPISKERIDDIKFKITIEKPIFFSNDISISLITDKLNKILEEMIIRKPESWIWSHNRWK